MNDRHVSPAPLQESHISISSSPMMDRYFTSMESESSNSSNSGDHLQGHSPPRRSGGAGGQLRLAGVTPPPPPPPPRAIRPVPAMGVPGVSAFSPYTRPRPGPSTTGGIPGLPSFTIYNRAPPRPDWYPHPNPGPGSISGLGFGYRYGYGFKYVGRVGGSGHGHGPGSFQGGGSTGKGTFEGGTHPHAGPVQGSGKGPFEGGALRIGGSPAKKRGREEGNASGSGKQQAAEVYPFPCPICGRGFMSEKALFGHMRSHPNRGWKGVHPPPAFNADEEFADVPGLNRPEGMEAAEAEGGGVAESPAEEGGGDTEMQQPRGEAEEHYALPDLNLPPPPSPDQY